MTPPDAPPEIDEVEAALHAVLDDEATPEQRRLVARDARLLVRLEELRATAAAVGTPPAPPADDVLDGLRARALSAALDDDGADPDAPDTAAPPATTPLRPRRPVPRWRSLPAVAAVVVLLAAVGIALLVGDRRDTSTETAADAAAESAGGDGAAAADVLDLPLVGSYASQDDLRSALETADPTTLAGVGDGPVEHAASAAEGATADAPEASADDEDADVDAPDTTAAGAGAATRSLAVDDPAVVRCDTVLRSTDERLAAAQAAVAVEVDGQTLLVLSNPVLDDDGGVENVLLTVFDALSCVPQLGVQR